MSDNIIYNILYVTDLHGDEVKYEYVLSFAVKYGFKYIINGGDMLPKTDLRKQNEFMPFLSNYFKRCSQSGIRHFGMLGNDDLRIHDEAFDLMCDESGAVNINKQSWSIDGRLSIIGLNLVLDHPWGIKDRCRLEIKHSEISKLRPDQSPAISLGKENQSDELLDNFWWKLSEETWSNLASFLPTFEEELKHLPLPLFDIRNAIYVIHMPPALMGLDTCRKGEKVGSMVLTNWIYRMQPLITLHGHIHESPLAQSGISPHEAFKSQIARTHCVQPGQDFYHHCSFATIQLTYDGCSKVIPEKVIIDYHNKNVNNNV